MKIPLSSRLQMCCGFVAPGERIADVGTDHGYLGIWLLQQGIASSVIASDVVPGPLSAARRNAEKYGFSERMEFYLSDGVQSIPRDFDTLVCAGMGADTIISILEHGAWLKDSRYRLILQCQSKTHLLRKYLSQQGYRISRETLLKDGKFLYTAMEAVYSPGHPLSVGDCWLPPVLLEAPREELKEYYRRVIGGLRVAAAHKKEPELIAALNELDANPALQWLKEADYGNCE